MNRKASIGHERHLNLICAVQKTDLQIPFSLLICEVEMPEKPLTKMERLALQRSTADILQHSLKSAFPSWHLSKSHSGRFAGTLASPVECGLDLEEIREKRIKQIVERVSRKEELYKILKNLPEELSGDSGILYFILWSIKEACYKAMQSKGAISVVVLEDLLNISERGFFAVVSDRLSGKKSVCISVGEEELVVSVAFSYSREDLSLFR